MNCFSKSSIRNLFFLMIVLTTALLSTSCSDDKDKSSIFFLTGTWYFSGDDELDKDDVFIFNSNGSVTYRYYDETLSGKFEYDEESGDLEIYWFGDGEHESLDVEFIRQNVIYIHGGDYGQYTRKN